MSYQQKYFHLYNGPYGLVDIAHRGIWINLGEEQLVHRIKQVFNSKITSVVVDLSTFVNYSENLIDSEVCLDWTVPYTKKLLLSSHSLNYHDFKKTQSDYNLVDPLINTPPNILLSKDQQLELQDQIFFYIKLSRFDTQFSEDLLATKFIKMRDHIFLTEIAISDIEEKLYNLCDQYFSVAPMVASQYISVIGKLYE